MIKSKLKVLLALNEMNQSELAVKTGVRPQTITNIVNNKIRQIPVDALNAICEVLHCDVGDVFGYVEEGEQKATTNAPKAPNNHETAKRGESTKEPQKVNLQSLYEEYGKDTILSIMGQLDIMEKFGNVVLQELVKYAKTQSVEPKE